MTIDLPPHISLADTWEKLVAEINDVLVDAMNHPRVLDSSHWLGIRVETSATLLPPVCQNASLTSWLEELRQNQIHHRITSHRAQPHAHYLYIRLCKPETPIPERIKPSTRELASIPATVIQAAADGWVRPLNKTPTKHRYNRIANDQTNLNTPSTTHRSNTMNTHPRRTKKQTRASRFSEWLFGKAEPVAIKTPDRTLPPQATPPDINTSDSWLEAFNQALTQATAEMIRKHVEPIYKEDPTCGFSIRAVKVGMNEASRPCLESLEKLPTDLSNRIAKIRMQQAHGAKQIRLDNFYGISLEADTNLLDGSIVQTLVSFDGSRFYLKFRFDGDYITLATDTVEPKVPTQPSKQESMKSETLLKMPLPSQKAETELIMPKSIRPELACLHIYIPGEEPISVKLYPEDLPYTLGREPLGHGYTFADNLTGLSRQHLILESFDTVGKNFFVYNKGANGTYSKGQRLSERFIHACKPDQWLSLGGPDGEDNVQIKLELGQ